MKGLEVSLVPRRLSALEAHCVHAVACGQSHMLAVIDSGAVAAWGSNEFGQLGEGMKTGISTYFCRARP